MTMTLDHRSGAPALHFPAITQLHRWALRVQRVYKVRPTTQARKELVDTFELPDDVSVYSLVDTTGMDLSADPEWMFNRTLVINADGDIEFRLTENLLLLRLSPDQFALPEIDEHPAILRWLYHGYDSTTSVDLMALAQRLGQPTATLLNQ